MKILKKLLALLLIPSILVLYLPRVGLAEEASYYAQTEIKKHTPEVLAMPEEEMPTEKMEKPAPKWPWIVLGVVLAGVAVAAFAGGGGGGGGSTPAQGGSVSVGW